MNLSPEWIQNFKNVYKKTLEKSQKDEMAKHSKAASSQPDNGQSVDRETFLVNVLEDDFFESRLDCVVRESIDGDKETLDNILERINTTHTSEVIDMDQFLQYFCRRGMVRESETLIF